MPPWELPGNCRRDCKPHRGGLLRQLGRASLAYAVLTVLTPSWLVLLAGLPEFARRDLLEMSAKRMDVEGWGETRKAYLNTV